MPDLRWAQYRAYGAATLVEWKLTVMSTPPAPQPGRKTPRSGPVEALVKAEKLTTIAFLLPLSIAMGWLLGAGLDRLLHQHWAAIAGLVLGAVAGFVQLFRMIADPRFLGGSAVDPSAPKGPGFDRDMKQNQGAGKWKP